MGTITRSFANLITADGPSAVADGSISAADLESGVGGKVLQVVTATASSTSISSTTDVTTNITASITPSSASNKILILITSVISQVDYGARVNDFCGVNLKRGGSSILGGGNNDFCSVYSVTPHAFFSPIAISYVDSPNTTSSTTYELFSRVETLGEVAGWNAGIGGRIILIEIAG